MALRRSTLGNEPLTDDRIPEDVDARVAMVAGLSRFQWRLTGKDLPRDIVRREGLGARPIEAESRRLAV
jgi:hypothetical protein